MHDTFDAGQDLGGFFFLYGSKLGVKVKLYNMGVEILVPTLNIYCTIINID